MDVDGATEDARNLRKINKAVYTLSNPSSKIAAVISEAINIIESTDDKIVIVSQWASLLNIIGMHLSQRGLGYLLLTGATKISDRGPIIENFNDPDHPTRVFLLSLATGGVGLNLIGGNHLFVVDPHWNPQLEFQAHDRVYRMGQKKNVQVLKFVTSATVEERVVSIQQKKVEVSDAVLTGMWQIFDNIQSNMHSGPVSTTLIFVLILRLRQICCHPGLMHINSKENDQDLNASSGGEGSAVGINLVDVIERMDVDGATEDARNLRKINKAVYTLSNPSSKIAAVISEAINIIESTDDKIVIVSQWASLLNIIGMHLSQRGLGYLLLTGATKISDRGPIIENFNDPDHPTRVFLLSLATGGVGLNLIGGNHLFVVDPHWNPQLEFQAHDRIYRMGQKKNVQVLKFVTSATVEERVVSIQQKKVEVSDAVLTGVSKIKKSGLSMADLRKLFDM
uniref:Putative dna repair protein snf2 family n=1 Tax=Lutzomyia longipalpis TaxID=7200 RepID=A0A7G3AEF9_LUTLO